VAKAIAKKVPKKPKAKPVKSKTAKPSAKNSKAYKIKVGDAAPAVVGALSATSGSSMKSISKLSELRNQKVVLYFYPRDNTPGCTLEGQDFRRLQKQFSIAGAVILGVSQDSLKSHENFKSKCGFTFELISDEKGELCRAFDVIQMKSMYGREFEGIERSTFVLDGKGVIRAEWRKLKVEGHAAEVLKFIEGMKS
jgi:peroxiredoxin Q/BCP